MFIVKNFCSVFHVFCLIMTETAHCVLLVLIVRVPFHQISPLYINRSHIGTYEHNVNVQNLSVLDRNSVSTAKSHVLCGS
jgi:hypothetical protein